MKLLVVCVKIDVRNVLGTKLGLSRYPKLVLPVLKGRAA